METYISKAMEPRQGNVDMAELLYTCIKLNYKYKHDEKVNKALKELLKKFDIPDNNLSCGDIYWTCKVDPAIWEKNLKAYDKRVNFENEVYKKDDKLKKKE